MFVGGAVGSVVGSAWVGSVVGSVVVLLSVAGIGWSSVGGSSVLFAWMGGGVGFCGGVTGGTVTEGEGGMKVAVEGIGVVLLKGRLVA